MGLYKRMIPFLQTIHLEVGVMKIRSPINLGAIVSSLLQAVADERNKIRISATRNAGKGEGNKESRFDTAKRCRHFDPSHEDLKGCR